MAAMYVGRPHNQKMKNVKTYFGNSRVCVKCKVDVQADGSSLNDLVVRIVFSEIRLAHNLVYGH